jgi:hypothetical protein
LLITIFQEPKSTRTAHGAYPPIRPNARLPDFQFRRNEYDRRACAIRLFEKLQEIRDATLLAKCDRHVHIERMRRNFYPGKFGNEDLE